MLNGQYLFGLKNIIFDSINLIDTDGSNKLQLVAGSNLSTDRILTLTTGDAARTITLSGNPTLADWFDQSVKAAATPSFVGLKLLETGSTPTLYGILAMPNLSSADKTYTLPSVTGSLAYSVAGTYAGIDTYINQGVLTTSTPQFTRLGVGGGAHAANVLAIAISTDNWMSTMYSSNGTPYGILLKGTATTAFNTATPLLQMVSELAAAPGVESTKYQFLASGLFLMSSDNNPTFRYVAYNAGAGPEIQFMRSKGTGAAQTTVADNDIVGDMVFYGHDGTAMIQCGSLIFAVNGTVVDAGDKVPCDLTLKLMDANGVLQTPIVFSDTAITLAAGVNIAANGTTGTKIGTATSQLLAFYNQTPVNQPDTVADAATQSLTGVATIDVGKTEADLTSCKNAINAIIDRLQELGLIAT